VKIVADTGPIIGLAKIGQIYLLQKLAAEVLIAPIVHKELYGKIGSETRQIDQALADFVHVGELGPTDSNIDDSLVKLGEGEKQSILLALKLKRKVLLLIDDRAGRQAADNLGIFKTGIAGLLILAKQKGYVGNVGILLEQLRQAGYWLSEEVLAVARNLAKE
jgi:predicted nucleic acid-binding protein